MRYGTSRQPRVTPGGGNTLCKGDSEGDPREAEGWRVRDCWQLSGSWGQLPWEPSALPVPPVAHH